MVVGFKVTSGDGGWGRRRKGERARGGDERACVRKGMERREREILGREGESLERVGMENKQGVKERITGKSGKWNDPNRGRS